MAWTVLVALGGVAMAALMEAVAAVVAVAAVFGDPPSEQLAASWDLAAWEAVARAAAGRVAAARARVVAARARAKAVLVDTLGR